MNASELKLSRLKARLAEATDPDVIRQLRREIALAEAELKLVARLMPRDN